MSHYRSARRAHSPTLGKSPCLSARPAKDTSDQRTVPPKVLPTESHPLILPCLKSPEPKTEARITTRGNPERSVRLYNFSECVRRHVPAAPVAPSTLKPPKPQHGHQLHLGHCHFYCTTVPGCLQSRQSSDLRIQYYQRDVVGVQPTRTVREWEVRGACHPRPRSRLCGWRENSPPLASAAQSGLPARRVYIYIYLY
jgi:hypothetical protein